MTVHKADTTGYYLWKAPTSGLPEFASGGNGITILPGFRNWVLLHPLRGKMPKGAVPIERIVAFLEALPKDE